MIAKAATYGLAARSLGWSAMLWLLVAAVSQLVFVAYITMFYGVRTASGDMAAWSAIMRNGYITGDSAGNAALIAHVLLAAYITAAGLLQLLPVVRRRAPRLHPWRMTSRSA
jgi:hypothetical protein